VTKINAKNFASKRGMVLKFVSAVNN